jgi:hypothetical protein
MEKFIYENLNLFLVENDLDSTYNNIKEFSKIYTINYKLVYESFEKVYNSKDCEYLTKHILENELLNKTKSGSGLFFSNLKSVFFNTALSKKLGLTSAGISLGNLASGYSISNTVMPLFGMAPTTIGSSGVMTGTLTAGMFSLSAMFALMAGAAIFKMVGNSERVLIKNYEESINESIGNLKRANPNLSNINAISNKIYDTILDQKCSKIKDKKELLNCGVRNYMEMSSNYILPELFRGYYRYLKNKNLNTDYINSAAELFLYSNNKDRTSYFIMKVYNKYIEIFDVLLKNDSQFKSKCIKELNSKCLNILKQEKKNAGK